MQANCKPGLRLSWKPFRTIRPGGFPRHPILLFKPSLAYQKYASSGLSLGISGTSDARGPLLQQCLIV